MGVIEIISLGIMDTSMEHHPSKIVPLTRKRTPSGG